MITYFSENGSFGSAEWRDLLIIDTRDFTDNDWEEIQEATDSERMAVAYAIAKKHGITDIHLPGDES